MARLVVSRQAVEDFKRIWAYIAVDSERAADRLLLAIDKRIQLLSAFPEIGPRRDEIRPGLRMLVHGQYLVLYEFDRDADRVEIVAVIEGMRNLDSLF